MDIRLGYDNTKLHIDRGMQDNKNKRKSIKRSSKVWRESPRIKKGISNGVYKGKSEKLGKWPWREKSKKEKEGTWRGMKGRDAGRSKTGARKDDSRPNYRRRISEAEERGKRLRESKYNIHYRNITREKLPWWEDKVERQKNTGKIQMWKRNQSKGLLERRERKKMQTM